MMREKGKTILRAVMTVLLLSGSFFLGGRAGRWKMSHMEERVANAAIHPESWGLGFGNPGEKPTGTAAAEALGRYDACYVGSTEEKIIYLTFDAGYENGNTPAILDALKKHRAPATFFLVGNYLKTQPELVRRMVAEGHLVGNHTLHHYDMDKISDKETFLAELEGVECLYEELIGAPMPRLYRPPQGCYSEQNLKLAQEAGYQTFFWSLAYVDWHEDKQPTGEEAFEKLLSRIHPGAIVLLHSTSRTNAEILDELLSEWEAMGYRFEPLTAAIKGLSAAHQSGKNIESLI